ncbi:MAG: hypothetical protein HQ507_01450 [Candidatus Marinimicrobia bacterium]|nr:hypothetical protein [Candidatus Neomarinimicrobiota bacterium]
MKSRIIFITLMLWGVSLFSQSYLDVLRPFRGMRGISGAESGVLPAAMSGSNALLGNPALLSYTKRAFVSTDVSFNQIAGTSVYNSAIAGNSSDQQFGFNSITYIRPVRVYRGAWVWGFNLQPVHSFASLGQFESVEPDGEFSYKYLQQDSGTLYALTAGSAVLVTMNTSIGYALSYLTGANNFTKLYEETDPQDIYTSERFIDSLQFRPSYHGFGARLGLLSEVSENLNLGISIELPTRISVSESASRNIIEWFDSDWIETDDGDSVLIVNDLPRKEIQYSVKSSSLEYVVWGPWRLGVGLGFGAAPLEASVNYRFHSYTSIAMKTDLYDTDSGENLGDLVDGQVTDYVKNVHEFSASLLWALDPLSLSFGASLMNDPLNYRFDNIIRMDLGIGYQLSSGLGFMLAYRNEQWQSDLDHILESNVKRSVDLENSSSKFQFGIKYVL